MHPVLAAIKTRLALSGTLSTSGTGSPVQSATRTVRGSGGLNFSSVSTSGGTPQYSKNGAGAANITNGLRVAVGPTDTILVQFTAAVGQTATFDVKRDDGTLIESVTLTRIS